jgi:hypothetical protein
MPGHLTVAGHSCFPGQWVELANWRADPVPEFEITYAHRWRDTERIEADEMRREGKCLVFITAVVVVDSPRTVVVLRLPLTEVATVQELPA